MTSWKTENGERVLCIFLSRRRRHFLTLMYLIMIALCAVGVGVLLADSSVRQGDRALEDLLNRQPFVIVLVASGAIMVSMFVWTIVQLRTRLEVSQDEIVRISPHRRPQVRQWSDLTAVRCAPGCVTLLFRNEPRLHLHYATGIRPSVAELQLLFQHSGRPFPMRNILGFIVLGDYRIHHGEKRTEEKQSIAPPAT